MRLRYALLTVLLPFYPIPALGQPPSSPDEAVLRTPASAAEVKPFVPNLRPQLQIAKLEGRITIDGDLNEAAWQHADRAVNFTESNPHQGSRPQSETVAMLTYDDDYLYVGMIAYENPKNIRARLTTRDNIFEDDMMGIIIDPYGDQVRAYEMYSNAYGIQADVLWTANGDDLSYDILYESEGKITSEGFQIELKIPFKSLRFPDQDVQNWRLTFWRNHPRDVHRSYSWAAMDRNNPCTFCAFGSLVGLQGVTSGNQLSVLPAFVTSQASSRSDRGIGAAPIKGELGVSAKYAVTQSTFLEATINPDFSQIESDATQIDLNTTTALFYAERRPFFREGYDLFDTHIDAVYTRSINDPIAAFKTLSRSGTTNFAFLGAVDENSPLLVPLEEQTNIFQLGRSYNAVARAVHSFDGNNSLGAIGTFRSFGVHGWNGVGGVDGRVRLYENVMMLGQGLLSYTDGLENKLYGEAPPAGSQSSHRPGMAGYLRLQRNTNTLYSNITYNMISPEFRAANGFITRSNQHNVNAFAEHQFHIDSSSWLVRISPSMNAGMIYNFDGKRKDEWWLPGINLMLKANTSLGANYMWSAETFRGFYTNGIRRLQMWGNTAPWSALSFGGFVMFGDVIWRNTATPELAKSRYYEIYGTWRPSDHLSISPSLRADKLDHMTGGNIYDVMLLRTAMSYQMDRHLSVRLIVEYNDFDRSMSLEPLIIYRINPFSVFYLGSSHGYESFGHQRLLDKIEQTRHIFAKIQYLFQV